MLLGPAFWKCHLHTIPVAWAEAGLLDVLLGRTWLCSEFLVNVRTVRTKNPHIFLSFLVLWSFRSKIISLRGSVALGQDQWKWNEWNECNAARGARSVALQETHRCSQEDALWPGNGPDVPRFSQKSEKHGA